MSRVTITIEDGGPIMAGTAEAVTVTVESDPVFPMVGLLPDTDKITRAQGAAWVMLEAVMDSAGAAQILLREPDGPREPSQEGDTTAQELEDGDGH